MVVISPVSDPNPQVAEEPRSAVATMSLARPFVSPKLLQLAQAVWEQQVRQLLFLDTGHVICVLQLHIQRRAGDPAGGGGAGVLLAGGCCTPAARRARQTGYEVILCALKPSS